MSACTWYEWFEHIWFEEATDVLVDTSGLVFSFTGRSSFLLHHSLQVATLEPATHAYSFWEGVPVEGKCAFGRLFAESRTMQVGFGVTLSGSRQPIQTCEKRRTQGVKRA